MKIINCFTTKPKNILKKMVNKIVISGKKKKVKRLSSTSSYYPSAFISNPCDQLFGPPLDNSLNNSLNNNASFKDKSFDTSIDKSVSINEANPGECESKNRSINSSCTETSNCISLADTTNRDVTSTLNYIPAPKWTKAQNCILEEAFKKSRYPKQSDLKLFAQRLSVMDSDVEVTKMNFCLLILNF